MTKDRGQLSYRKRLTKDKEMCNEIGGMEDIVAIINQKIEDYKGYQREYYHKNKDKK